MVANSMNSRLLIVISLLVALWLSIVPMPEWLQWSRPDFVAMVLIYWLITMPERVGIGVAWIAGLTQDILEGCPLGQNAFALSILAYLTLILYQRLRMYTSLQQAAVVFILIGLIQLLCHWVQTLTGTVSPNLMFLLPALVSALLWPSLSLVLKVLRQAYYAY